MNKILLIISREFLTRVQKKSFIIASILGPIVIGAVLILPTYFAMQGGDSKTVQVLDESGMFAETFVSNDEMTYVYISDDLETAKTNLLNSDFDGLVYVPEFDIEEPEGFAFYSSSNPSMALVRRIEGIIDTKIENVRLSNSGLDREVIESFKVNIGVSTINLSDSGAEKQGSSGAATAIGYFASFLIYMFVFIYGAMCMRGVIEEKSSRIVEVIISSVRPFQLMMGKVIGIASVGLMQFIVWILLSTGVVMGVSAVMGISQEPDPQEMGVEMPQRADPTMAQKAFEALESINYATVLVSFVFYFIGGYLLYGALFAAVGSASESDADAQQFMFPVTAPLIASIVMLSIVLQDPHGSLAFWLSMVPFTSPVIMMMRVPFGVEVWELLLSMALLVVGFIFTIWVAGRIYRVGILMHGAKVNWKVLAKWFMSND